MKNGRNYAIQADPDHNPQFSRQWTEPPTDESSRGTGELVDITSRKVIAHWLAQATDLEGEAAQYALATADEARRMMGLSWGEVVGIGSRPISTLYSAKRPASTTTRPPSPPAAPGWPSS